MFQAQQFQTMMYLPNQDAVMAHAQLPLSKVTLTGIRVLDDLDSVFHFHVSLVSSNEHSLHWDINPSGVGTNMMNGLLQIHCKDYACSAENTITFAVPVVLGEKTVAEALTHILGKRRDKYTFNNEGQGCRNWCITILQDLVEGNFVPGNAHELFRAWEAEQHAAYGAPRFPMPETPGTFY
jgi:hypothetical protein